MAAQQNITSIADRYRAHDTSSEGSYLETLLAVLEDTLEDIYSGSAQPDIKAKASNAINLAHMAQEKLSALLR